MTIDLNKRNEAKTIIDNKEIDKTIDCVAYLRSIGWLDNHEEEMIKIGEMEIINKLLSLLFGENSYKVIKND